MVKNNLSSAAHSVLEYAISRAMLEGTTGSLSINLPLSDLVEEYGGKSELEGQESMVLKVNITVKLEKGKEDFIVEEELDEH